MKGRKNNKRRMSYYLRSIAFLAILFTLPSQALAFVYAEVEYVSFPSSTVALSPADYEVGIWNNSDAADRLDLNVYVDGNYIGYLTYYNVPSNYSFTTTITIPGGYLTEGYHTISFCLDTCDSDTSYWYGTPDVSVKSITTSTTQALADTTITTVLENLGNGDAEWFSVYMYITLEGGQEQYIDSWWIDTFPGYTAGNLTITFAGGLPEGTHAIRVVADTVSGESITSNNSLTVYPSFVGTPDVSVNSITTSTTQALADTTITTV
ncbi:MAG: hypothetical protein GY820_41040, partial [Gammaproteobacteria bacterium]|nr:hypothetical protein [Gammaproteobacteria bacterium]